MLSLSLILPILIIAVITLGALLVVIGAIYYIQQMYRYSHNVWSRWTRSGRAVHYMPVRAVCYGNRPTPDDNFDMAARGALGLADSSLIFTDNRRSILNTMISLDSIRQIVLRRTDGLPTRFRKKQSILVIHAELPVGWRVYTFKCAKPAVLANQISQLSKQPVEDYAAAREDFGPADVTCMIQDVGGKVLFEGQITLYLAPDRLLLNWQNAIPLAQIHRVDTFPAGSLTALNNAATDLLRIEYRTPNGTRRTAGFLLDNAQVWADSIHAATRAPTGRHQPQQAQRQPSDAKNI
ncbi:MAG: hypothetical protein JXJ20_02170 [Anaerolineae bacterium]|nr:hypothetical protein [Anaerolineae bacterium]